MAHKAKEVVTAEQQMKHDAKELTNEEQQKTEAPDHTWRFVVSAESICVRFHVCMLLARQYECQVKHDKLRRKIANVPVLGVSTKTL